MTLPATNQNRVLDSSTPDNGDRETGWDPFEVWRTRVLLPRLAESAVEKAAEVAASPPPAIEFIRP